MLAAQHLVANGVHYAAIVTAAAAVVTAVIAAVAVVFAFFQLRDAGSDRRERNRPAVVVDLVPTEQAWSGTAILVVQNIGATSAQNVRLEFDPPIWSDGDALDAELRWWTSQTFPTVPPGRVLRTFFSSVQRHQKAADRPWRFTVTVHCEDYRHRTQPLATYVIDLESATRNVGLTRHGVHELTEAVEKLDRRLSELITTPIASGRGFRVYTRTLDDVEQKEQGWMEDHITSRPSEADGAPSSSGDE